MVNSGARSGQSKYFVSDFPSYRIVTSRDSHLNLFDFGCGDLTQFRVVNDYKCVHFAESRVEPAMSFL